jgi:hypothetical protein
MTEDPRKSWFERFLPRSPSKTIFIVAMASYSWTSASLLSAFVNVFAGMRPPASFYAPHVPPGFQVAILIFLDPIIESLLLIGAIELCGRLSERSWVQILIATVGVATLHCYPWKPHAIIVAPGVAIDAFSYLYWRRTSRKEAFGVIASIHALHNSISALWMIAHIVRHG